MASVVLCSELGRGSGHLAKLADYAVELEAQRYSVKLVTHDLHAAHAVREFVDVAIFQAPVFRDPNRPDTDQNLKSFASILIQNGYRSAHSLAPLLRGWLHILATLQADVVVADHAPTAILAAKLLRIPRIMTGSGFCVPPLTSPLASLSPWMDMPESELVYEDSLLVKAVNDTTAELGFAGAEIEHGRDLFHEAAQWIFSIPELDHFGARDQPYVVRWYNSAPRLSPEWPRVRGDKIFLYSHPDSPFLDPALEQLGLTQQPALVVVPEASSGLIERYEGTSVKLQRELVNLKQAADECTIFIHNGNHDMAYELLSYGVPSIILPSKPDQVMLAYQLAEQGLAFVGPEFSELLDISALIQVSKREDQVWLNCSNLQMKYENHQSLHRLHDLVKAELLA